MTFQIKLGSTITATIGQQKVIGTATGVGTHKGKTVIDINTPDGGERFVYLHQIEDVTDPAPKVCDAAPIQKNDVVVFNKVPASTYLTAGIQYKAESITKREIYFRNVVTGSGCHVPHYELKQSEWQVIPQGWDAVGTENENVMPKFKAGDIVIYTNPQGVCWGERTVLGAEYWERDYGSHWRYFISDSDSPWYPVHENCLALAPLPTITSKL